MTGRASVLALLIACRPEGDCVYPTTRDGNSTNDDFRFHRSNSRKARAAGASLKLRGASGAPMRPLAFPVR